MLTNLDCELFPKDCEVVHVPSHDQWIYLIQKNGSSSLRITGERKGWIIYRNEDIKSFDFVDIYIRHPQSRYLSGINTFVQHLIRDDSRLDKNTCEIIATKYLFLNRHYLPQWHWLVNLVRFIDPDCILRLHDLEDLASITQLKDRADVTPMSPLDEKKIMDLSGNISLWFLLDEILWGLRGQSFTWSALLEIYKKHPRQPLGMMTETAFEIVNVLR